MGSSVPSDDPFGGDEGGSEKPFDDTPFDAGVEADEESNPEKYIQQLSGKLGQSLRSYTNDSGQPNFDLEKFAVNSVLSATHTGEMEQSDQTDIINKVKNSGNDGGGNEEGGLDADGGLNLPNDEGGDEEGGEGNPDISLDDIDMEESHNPNANGKTVFSDATLGVKDGGMEENKYLNLENTKKRSIFVDNIRNMVRQTLTESPTVLPATKPIVNPTKPRPTRKGKPFRITPREIPNPQPKAMNEGGDEGKEIRFIELSKTSDDARVITIDFNVGDISFSDVKFNVIEGTGKALEGEVGPWVYEYKTDPMGDERKEYHVFATLQSQIEYAPQNNFLYLGTVEDEKNNPEITEV